MPTASRIRWTTPVLFVLSLALIALSAEAQCTQTASISQWRCWEQAITSSVNFYAAGSGNPYRDLTLRIHFVDSISGSNFDQDAFWVADTIHPTQFKVRAGLSAGNWTWSIAGCTGTTGGKSCASGVTWTPASGQVTVTTSTSGPQVYARGFPTQFPFYSTDGTYG